MRMRILMVGDDQNYMTPDAELLKERGFAVYTCSYDKVSEMISETKPALIYINSGDPGAESTNAYHGILDNIQYASLPVVYTLAEDDVYLVNKKRTASRDKRNMICDNLIDSIKTALLNNIAKAKKRIKMPLDNLGFPFYASRA
jgi:DNA-binding NtrC family response regulator